MFRAFDLFSVTGKYCQMFKDAAYVYSEETVYLKVLLAIVLLAF